MERVEIPKMYVFYTITDNVMVVVTNEHTLKKEIVEIEYHNKDMESEYTTLEDIANQLKDKYCCFTVYVETALGGEIFRYNNHADNSWWKIGKLDGYA